MQNSHSLEPQAPAARTELEVSRDVLTQFRPGHKTNVGRPRTKKKLPSAVESALAMNFNPLEAMLHVAKHGAILEPDGTETSVPQPERLKILREVTVYTHSKAVQKVEGQVAHAHFDVTHIMLDPALSAAAETLALAQIEQDRDSPAIDAEFEDITDGD